MPDDRPLSEKLEALAHPESGATAGERAAAEAALARLRRTARPLQSAGGSLRDSILGAPDRTEVRGVHVMYPSGYWYFIDEDEVDWEAVDSMQLRYRLEGESAIRTGKRVVKRL